MRTLSVRARKSSGSVCVTRVRCGCACAASASMPAGGGLSRTRAIRSSGTCGSWRPVVFGACVKPSFASRLSRITRRLSVRAFSFSKERQVAQATWAVGWLQASSAAEAARHAASSSRLAGLARGPRGAPRGRVVRQRKGSGVARCAMCGRGRRVLHCTRSGAHAAATAAAAPAARVRVPAHDLPPARTRTIL